LKQPTNQMNNLFISGMFRSGTTFLARALNTHENLIVASDPYFEFFKHTRNLFYRGKIQGYDEDHPLEDYCFHQEEALVQEFHDSFFTIEYDQEQIDILKEKIKKRVVLFSPLIIPFVNQLNPGTVEEVLSSLNKIVRDAYPKENPIYVGTKHVWTDEFIGLLTKNENLSYKSIHLIRDPRGVVASSKKSVDGGYPMLFLIRQWRKSVAYVIANRNNKNVLIMRYEDLISSPEDKFREISEFLEIEYHEDFLNVSKYKDGSGEPWYQNSSYTKYEKGQSINTKSITSWKEVLNHDEVDIIESLCNREMRYLKYEVEGKVEVPMQAIQNYESQNNRIDDWIRKYDFDFTPERIEEEVTRTKMLNNGIDHGSDEQRLDSIFINQDIYKQLSEIES